MKLYLKLSFASALLAVASIAVIGMTSGESDERLLRPIVIDPDDMESVRRGKPLYATHCASCHGANLEGQENWRERLPNGRLPAPPHDPSGHTWHHADAHLYAMTRYGIEALLERPYDTDMPAYEGVLSDREIRDVLAYIKSTWPAEIRMRQDALSRRFNQSLRE